ncbi:5698_t:CDS:2 [Diversispora eburnea]|uniref:5698_t:CDS:1 n=1 Tax=Diversispora eburnea TaxID=1213867 RepID=A0A9N8UZ97_9GLOM|nr:5698_t:CDS:2 [Diversispora eburnea]
MTKANKKNKSKGTKNSERSNTRALTKERTHESQHDPFGVVAPSSTVSTTTTRSSSIEPQQQNLENSSKPKTRKCKSKRKNSTTSKKNTKSKQNSKQGHIKPPEIDYSSHSSDDVDELKLKREYRRHMKESDEKEANFIVLRDIKREIDEEETSLKSETHPKYKEEINQLDMKIQQSREVQDKRKELGTEHAKIEYNAGALQVKQQYVLRKELIEKLEISKYQIIREYNRLISGSRYQMYDLIIREGAILPSMNDFERRNYIENDFRAITLGPRISNPLAVPAEVRPRISQNLLPPRTNDSIGNASSVFSSYGSRNNMNNVLRNQQSLLNNNLMSNGLNSMSSNFMDIDYRQRQSQNRLMSPNVNRISSRTTSDWSNLSNSISSLSPLNLRQQAMPTNSIDECSVMSSSCSSGPPPKSEIIYGWLEKGSKGKNDSDR